jgi:hypothetical protein
MPTQTPTATPTPTEPPSFVDAVIVGLADRIGHRP